ncbi:MAG: hypothetical protein ICV74_00365 [Thermoleophilia bacterium]|nr:hypothetical protein [Thermoleophilia bacterium]
MADLPDADASYGIVCPHCGKAFEAQPLSGGAPRYQGFKCPHCRLFVAYERAEEVGQGERAP